MKDKGKAIYMLCMEKELHRKLKTCLAMDGQTMAAFFRNHANKRVIERGESMRRGRSEWALEDNAK